MAEEKAMENPEFSRPLAMDRVPLTGMTMTVTAAADERAALARRLGLPAIASLIAVFRLRPGPGGVIDAVGTMAARVTQACIVSLDEFSADVTEEFSLRFVSAGYESEELDPDAVDEIPVTAGLMDLGEAAAEQLALALDPYPRKPGATLAGDTDDSAMNPFAGLARPRRPH